jgi:probable rRNA maturation factor
VIYLNGFKNKPLAQAVLKTIKKIYKLEKLKNKIVSVSLVSSSRIQKLNKNFRSKNKVTDVLSFPQTEHGILGDVIICLSVAKTQAKEYGHTLERELCFLTTHGIYHLLGYDHHTAPETKRMRRKEKIIMGDR